MEPAWRAQLARTLWGTSGLIWALRPISHGKGDAGGGLS
jgi:hypothetical protein